MFAKRSAAFMEHFSIPFPLLDPRLLHALILFTTLATSIGFYTRAWLHLKAFKKRCVGGGGSGLVGLLCRGD